MKTYFVDFTGVKTYWDFYEALREGLELPNWFGKNTDALWDMLTGYMEDPAIIRIQGLDRLPKSLSVQVERFKEVIAELPIDAPYVDYQFVFYD